jgi:Trypsin-co-occurring domain 2
MRFLSKGGLQVNDRVPGVRLADAVELVRSELQEARERGASSSLAFVPGPVELEFEVVFDATAGADAGVRVWVVSLGAKGEVSRGQTQRLKVTLSPVDRATGKSPQISDEGSR